MRKIIHSIVVLVLLQSSHAFCMLAARPGALAFRALGVARTVHTVGNNGRKNFLADLAKKRSDLEKQCFGHGGLVDLMSLGPDESLQRQYRDYQAQIAAIKKQEEALSKKRIALKNDKSD